MGEALTRCLPLFRMGEAGHNAPMKWLLPVAFVVLAWGGSVAQAPKSADELAKLGPQVGARVPDQPAGTRTETRHLVVTTSVSDAVVAPGTRFSLLVDVAPRPGMHVYSPEQHDYIPIALTIEEAPAFKLHPAVFPKAETYYFKPLDETQLVYSKPFRIVQDVTVALTPAVLERARTAGATLTVKGMLKYQACDESVCYLPVNLPVSWTVTLRPLER